MARLTDLELQGVINDAPSAIDALMSSNPDCTGIERMYQLMLKKVAICMLEDACEIQTLRQQNADMAAWINAQQEGVK